MTKSPPCRIAHIEWHTHDTDLVFADVVGSQPGGWHAAPPCWTAAGWRCSVGRFCCWRWTAAAGLGGSFSHALLFPTRSQIIKKADTTNQHTNKPSKCAIKRWEKAEKTRFRAYAQLVRHGVGTNQFARPISQVAVGAHPLAIASARRRFREADGECLSRRSPLVHSAMRGRSRRPPREGQCFGPAAGAHPPPPPPPENGRRRLTPWLARWVDGWVAACLARWITHTKSRMRKRCTFLEPSDILRCGSRTQLQCVSSASIHLA